MRKVFSSHNLVEVHHLKNLLGMEGIRAVVRNEFLSSAMGELPPAECQAEVWLLNESDLSRAEQVLHSENRGGPDWTCACGEVCEAQFTQCWRCGANRR